MTPGEGASTTAPTPAQAELLGDLGDETGERLRRAMSRAWTAFAFYRRRFQDIGLDADDLEEMEALGVLGRLLPLDAQGLHLLANESIASTPEIIDIETSSGTTGPRKRRPITYSDDRSETAFLARLFAVAGVGPSDRVACVDTGPLTLMVSFTRALEALGVGEAYSYSVGPDAASTANGLLALDPTVIITVPSVVERYLTALVERHRAGGTSSLRAVIYAGEPLSSQTRRTLQDELGVEVFSYYGASETSALGIECRAHSGTHIFTDRSVVEITGDHDGTGGELLVTTLHQEGLPLLRYALGDRVEARTGPCPCGLPYPRVDVRGRADRTVSLLGVKMSYEALRDAAYRDLPGPRLMEARLTGNGRETLTVVLPEALSGREKTIRRSLLNEEPDLGFLVGGRFLRLELEFVQEARLSPSRKAPRIVDLRASPRADR